MLKVGDKVLAPNPLGGQDLVGFIVGKDRWKLAVDFERNSSDVWTYAVGEVTLFEVAS